VTLPLRTLTLIGRFAPAALAIVLMGCQTAGPAAGSGTLGTDRAAAPTSVQHPNGSQTAQAQRTNVATSSGGVTMGVGY
jgi:hypothetical protein